jgi:hypothetical protein
VDTDNSSGRAFRFSYKTALDHARGLLKFWKSWVSVAAVVFGALWGLLAASIHLLGFHIHGWPAYVIMVAASLAPATALTLRRYINSVPDGLENESKAARRIAHLRRDMWEFRLARQLLRDKLSRLDQELDDLLSGRVYVPAQGPGSVSAYMRWLTARPGNLMRMVDVAKRLLIHDLPAAVQPRRERVAVPAEITDVTNKIRSLYAETIAFEREGRAITPCESFDRAHELQLGWAAPIRHAVQQIFKILDQIISVDLSHTASLAFQIVFETPPGVDEFCEELDRLSASFPEGLGNVDPCAF